MSAVQRGRRGQTRDVRLGEAITPQQVIDEMITGVGELTDLDDVLEAELVGAGLLSMATAAGILIQSEQSEAETVAGVDPAADLVTRTVARCEEHRSPGSLALLLALGAVAEGEIGDVVSATAARLAAAGVPEPSWATQLTEPVTVGQCLRLVDDASTGAILIGEFARVGRNHLIVVSVNHLACGQADRIAIVDGAESPRLLTEIRATQGVRILEEKLDPADFRWHAEAALRARADHDGGAEAEAVLGGLVDEDDVPGYLPLAMLLRARLRTLPVPQREAPSHDACEHADDVDLLTMISQIAAGGVSPGGGRGRGYGGRRGTRLPAKRRRTDGPAPVYQIKVGLRGARPPIWRRLEVPANISLAKLHEVIQIAFDWDDSHLHVFETSYGEFGIPDPTLEHRSEQPVSLEQVAPTEKSKIRYLYDFGDNWEHEILVEKVLDREQGVRYPRCTGGRRAAPPEDCGGVWGYANLIDVLADPNSPEHVDMMEWLGLDDPAEFAPAAFDPAAITAALSR